jgi:hypothetical protein
MSEIQPNTAGALDAARAALITALAPIRAARAARRRATLGEVITLAERIVDVHAAGNAARVGGGEPLELPPLADVPAIVRGLVRRGTADSAPFAIVARPRSADRHSDDRAARVSYWLRTGLQWHRGNGSLWGDYPWALRTYREAQEADTLAQSMLQVLGQGSTAVGNWARALGVNS